MKYIIHHKEATEREKCVENIVKLTGAEIVEAVWCPIFPVLGCILSHLKVARMGQGGYYVFEDDCEVFGDFLSVPLDSDIIYFGINGKALQKKPIECIHYWGTHAMFISEKARLILLEHWEKELEVLYPKGFPAFDELLSVLAYRHKLSIKILDLVGQKKGFVSYISGNVRG